MPRQSVAVRAERLEERVTILEELPGRVDALSTQISQLREEMHREFSNLRGETRAGDEEVVRSLREEIREGDDRVMEHARELHRYLTAQIQAGDEQTMNQTRMLYEDLKVQIQAGDDRVMNHARMLHDDLKADLKSIREGLPSATRRRRRPKS